MMDLKDSDQFQDGSSDSSSINVDIPARYPIFYETLQVHFPGSLPMTDYFGNTYNTLNSYGFDQGNTAGMVAICRDEITEALFEEVIQYWGKTFNCCSLSGFVMMGKTGLAAATAHTPIDNGIRRFVFYAMPHIAISGDGKIGEVYREGIQQVSHACGALEAIAEELQSGHLQLMLDMQDIEQSMIRQKIISAIRYGDQPDLVALTKLASQIIAQDVKALLSPLDRSVFHYAVLTGIQIHGPLDTHWIYPQEFYLVSSDFSEGQKDLR